MDLSQQWQRRTDNYCPVHLLKSNVRAVPEHTGVGSTGPLEFQSVQCPQADYAFRIINRQAPLTDWLQALKKKVACHTR